jgi:hypothetical protein
MSHLHYAKIPINVIFPKPQIHVLSFHGNTFEVISLTEESKSFLWLIKVFFQCWIQILMLCYLKVLSMPLLRCSILHSSTICSKSVEQLTPYYWASLTNKAFFTALTQSYVIISWTDAINSLLVAFWRKKHLRDSLLGRWLYAWGKCTHFI